ncbi:hypothetical protein BC936DRAFT_140271 [Jimgerdemannia flammicorona]|uniref:Uncharacterized protein n=1 Tax=Jimgerdemannia flammicorona TaxID=994334 RepID=A0A433AVM5_9FUNG|nr:hypothetical protein BC936DRAFT_140271 [Jimgerdemannia flammicorona]
MDLLRNASGALQRQRHPGKITPSTRPTFSTSLFVLESGGNSLSSEDYVRYVIKLVEVNGAEAENLRHSGLTELSRSVECCVQATIICDCLACPHLPHRSHGQL